MMTIHGCYKIKTVNFKTTLRSSGSVSSRLTESTGNTRVKSTFTSANYFSQSELHILQILYMLIPWTRSCWTSIKIKRYTYFPIKNYLTFKREIIIFEFHKTYFEMSAK